MSKKNELKPIKVEMVAIALIKPYWRNARNNDKTVKQLASSIMKYGFNVPIILDKNHCIIAGHARYKACIGLGYTEIPCVISDMSEQDAKEYRIADNKVGELTKWDIKQLEQEVKEISNNQFLESFFDTDFASGFYVVEKEKEPEEENRQNNMVYPPRYKEEESSEPRYPDRDRQNRNEEESGNDGYDGSNNNEPPIIHSPIIPQQKQEQVGVADLQKSQEKISNIITDKIERKDASLIALICPCCSESFSLERKYLQRMLDGEFDITNEISKFKEK